MFLLSESEQREWLVLSFVNLNLHDNGKIETFLSSLEMNHSTTIRDEFLFRVKDLLIPDPWDEPWCFHIAMLSALETFALARKVLSLIQLELSMILRDIEIQSKTVSEQVNNSMEQGMLQENVYRNPFSEFRTGTAGGIAGELTELLNQKLVKLHIQINPVPTILKDGRFFYEIEFRNESLEDLLYADLVRYIAANKKLIRCSECNSYIESLSKQQEARIKKGQPVYHRTENDVDDPSSCWRRSRRHKDRIRKRKKGPV